MIGMGTIANVLTVLVGGTIGLQLGRGIPEKYQDTIMQGVAMAVCIIGLQMALKSQNIIIVIVSMVVGGILGEALGIEDKLNSLGQWLGTKIGSHAKGKGDFAEGFVAASLIFCVGAMAIVGSLQDGLKADPSILYAKATLDGITSTILAANLGLGVAFSALSIGIYQGTLTALAFLIGPYMTEAVTTEVSATGGLLIIAISINMLQILKIRIGNLLPAMFIAGIVASFVS